MNDPYHWFPNALYNNLFALVFFGGFLVELLVRRMGERRRTGAAQKGDRGSYWLVYMAGTISVVVCFFLRYWGVGVLPASVQYLGLGLMLAGLLLREWSILVLGAFFSPVVEIEAGHRLVTAGPYRWIRHPAYTGMILYFLGISLALATWVGALVVLAAMVAATLYRMRVEEDLLLAAFGAEYQAYMSRTWRLFPGW